MAVVHILREGRTVCGLFDGKPPKDWPDGHLWTSLDRSSRATCVPCREGRPASTPTNPPSALATAKAVWTYSQSQIRKYIGCAAQWMFTYRYELKRPATPPQIIGSGVHDAAQAGADYKLREHAMPPLDYVTDVAAQSVDDRIKDEGLMPDPEDYPAGAAQVKDHTVELARVYYADKDMLPSVDPIETEKPFEIGFENVPYRLRGRLDLVERVTILEGNRPLKTARRVVGIQELKTKGRSEKDVSAAERVQLSVYAMGFAATHAGEMPGIARVRSIVKTKEPKTHLATFTPGTEDIRFAQNVIAQVHAGIQAEVFPPNREAWFCSRRSCQFWEPCEKKFGGTVRP